MVWIAFDFEGTKMYAFIIAVCIICHKAVHDAVTFGKGLL